MRRVVLALLLLAAVSAALAARDDEPAASAPVRGAAGASSAPLSETELRWIRAYARWSIEVGDAELGTPGVRQELADCAAVLRTTAGQAPTTRLAAAQAFAEGACSALTGGRTEAVVHRRIDRADDALWPLLLATSDLPVTDEATVVSRSSAALGTIASTYVGEDVEVLCWDDSDWRRLIREENAWSDLDDDPDYVDGLAFADEGRIHMLLEDCNTLGRLPLERLADRGREALIDAADAVTVFAHELHHFLVTEGTEAEVECAAVDALPRVARAFGLDRDERELIRKTYVESVRPELADEYREAC